MNSFSLFVLPSAVLIIVVYAFIKGVKVFDCFTEGAKNGINIALSLLPPLLALITAVTALRVSGAIDIVCSCIKPVTDFLGIKSEVVPLCLLSPVSGSGSLSAYKDLLSLYGADSLIGQISSVIMCSTETTFYATTVYYSAVNVKKMRHTIPCALCADFTSFILSSFFVKLFFKQ